MPYHAFLFYNFLALQFSKIVILKQFSSAFFSTDDREWGYGVVVSVQRQDKAPVSSPDSYIVDTLLYCSPPTASKRAQPLPLTSTEGEMVVVPVALPLLSLLSTLRIAIPAELKSAEQKNHVLSTLQELVRRYPDGELPELDPGEDLGIKDSAVLAAATEERSLKKKIRELESAGAGDGASSAGDVATQLEVFRKKAAMLAEADKLERKAKESDVANFQEEARNRLAVLRKLGHVSADDVVTDKGKAACEVDTGDELMASEMMFNGTFGSLDKHQLAALVSCLVPVENSNVSWRCDQAIPSEVLWPHLLCCQDGLKIILKNES